METLDAQQSKALEALLSGKTVEAAAKAAKCDRSTVHRWLREPGFAAAYRDGRQQLMRHATTQLQAATDAAVTTLKAVMDDSTAPAGARVSAARVVLESSIKGIELEDLAERLEALETMLKQKGGA